MIIDSLKNASLYYGLGSRVTAGLKFLEKSNIAALATGKHEIDGSNVFAIVQRGETKPQESGKWEAHRRYIDIQYVAEGVEKMGYANLDAMTVEQPYNDQDDYLLCKGEGDFFAVRAGTFVVFAPQDVHMPSLALTKPQPVVKVVVKVLV